MHVGSMVLAWTSLGQTALCRRQLSQLQEELTNEQQQLADTNMDMQMSQRYAFTGV